MKRRLALALFALILPSFVPASEAFAWECLAGSCPVWCETVPYGITVASPDLGDATTVSEVQRAMSDWTTQACTDLTVSYTGRSGATAGNGDGQSVIGWVESGWRHGSSAIGVTGPRWNGRNCIQEADMEMNGQNFTWITGAGRGSNVNAYSIALHEGGHYYGLGHSSSSAATMYFAYTGGIDAIGDDDRNGICTLYPGEGGGMVDCTTAGCPAGQMCVDRMCQAVVGDGTVCAGCSTSADCGGSSDLCLRYPTGAGFCGRACGSSADCPGSGDQCVGIMGGGNQCIRVQGGMPSCAGSGPTPECTSDAQCDATERCDPTSQTCVPRPGGLAGLGEPCTESSECSSDVCASSPDGGRCTQRCNGFDTSSCPGGFYCDGEALGTCGDGLCIAGASGVAPLGSPCATDTDCASLMCDRGTCGSPCQPGEGTIVCPMGYQCQTGSLPGCGACKPEGSLGDLGDACETADDCASGECARRGDETFCTDLCTDDSDCPRGFACLSAGEFSVCAPTETDDPRVDGGCGCTVPAGDSAPSPWVLLLVIPAIVWWRRRRTGRISGR